MSASKTRDYYQQLFSPDSDESFISLSFNKEDNFDIPNFGDSFGVHNECNISTSGSNSEFNLEDMEQHLDALYKQFDMDDLSLESEFEEGNIHIDISSINGEHTLPSVHPDTHSVSSSSTISSLDFLDEADMIRLLHDDSEENILRKSAHYRNKEPCSSNNINSFSPSPTITHNDRIGTFNIQNQYDHSIAAKLFIEGEFSFLCLQEPFASQDSINDAWGAYRRYELNSARIVCFETHHQIIMFDSWRWGGKIIDNFSSILNGRISSIAFGFDNGQSIGILSVYGYARGGANAEEVSRKNDLRRALIFAIKKIQRQWRKKFPNIHVMVLGDMQETYTTSDLDNLGVCRYKSDKELSIIHSLASTHTSLVRDRTPIGSQYLTRFGSEGARGIDHILFPTSTGAQALVTAAAIDNTLGSFFFPSDHRLLHCNIIRYGANNAEMGESKLGFAFRDIFQLKLRRSGEHGSSLSFDESQFKHCIKYEKQKALYNKVQDVTGNSATATSFHLNSIEKSIKMLFKSLYNEGIDQKVNGKENKLVEISERQAAELSAVTNAFDAGIKDTMTFLDLSHEKDTFSSMAKTRVDIRKRSTFKLFDNLPIPTKLRYLRGWIKEKNRRIKRYLGSIHEFQLRSRNHSVCGIAENILKDWNNTLNSSNLKNKGRDIQSALLRETEERENHVNAIQAKSPELLGKKVEPRKVHSHQDGNNLKHVSDSTAKLINSWLLDAGCSQCFNSRRKKDTFECLYQDLDTWSKPLLTIKADNISWNNTTEVQVLKDLLLASSQTLRNLENRIGVVQKSYKIQNLEYLLQVNKIEEFTRKVRPKSREAPTTHTEIWDTKLGAFRACRSDNEELIATGDHHGTWMGNSAAKETCAFAKLKEKGLLGIRGVELSPDRKVKSSDIPNLIHNGDTLTACEKRKFLEAHGKHTSELFRAPDQDYAELSYPFFLKSAEGNMSKDDVLTDMFWKSISSIPGKARYDGFQMAVVGRFGVRWQKCLLDIIKLILIMRFIPKKLKSIARFPIPKPGKVNEYRPISLCHDIYCFVNSVSTKFSSQGIMEAKILHEGIAAYVKGKGCSMLVGVEQGLREDCVESGVPTSQTDEDEEKFFDRIPVEILLAAMRVNGFPEQGYLELKASGMGAKSVEIITVKGVAHARFVCGLEQGNPDSPTIANLVIKFKHDIWKNILEEIGDKNFNSLKPDKLQNKYVTKKNRDAYKFHISDGADGTVTVDRIGYCDDNTRYTSSFDEQEVLLATKLYIKRAGDLSLVTKIGRKGSKSEVQYYNLTAETALKLKPLHSFAWSFAKDKPTSERVPFKIQLQKTELEKVYKLTKFHSLSEEEKEAFLKIFRPEAHKHLGLISTLNGNTYAASKEVLHKAKARMTSLKMWNMDHGAQQLSANMLCSTIHSYAPLQMGHNTEDLMECDELLLNSVLKRKGLSKSDAKHSIFLDDSKGGFGFKSYLDIDLVANARELEIILNGKMLDSEVLRARAAAFLLRHDRPEDEVTYNFTGKAITKLARYGIHLRDSKDGIINYILGNYNNMKQYSSVGHESYKDTESFTIGHGKEANNRIAFGSKFHLFLRRAIDSEGNIKQNLIIPENLFPKISRLKLKRLVQQFRNSQFDENASSFNFWEWKGTTNSETLSTDPLQWNFINIADKIKTKFPTEFWKFTPEHIRIEAQRFSDLRYSHPDIIESLTSAPFPPFISTDGSHFKKPKDSPSVTTGAAVLCIPNIKSDNDFFGSQKWTSEKSIPILARMAKCPTAYGTQSSDIAHGECLATCLGLEMLPNFPKILITDSRSTRDVAKALRDRNKDSGNDRTYIRRIISGIGKRYLDNGLSPKFDTYEKENRSIMKEKLSQCVELCRGWTNSREQKEDANVNKRCWNRNYFETHSDNVFFKVDSHQLNASGTSLKHPPRYNTMIPNFFLLHTNHLADLGAELATKPIFFHRDEAKEFHLPNSNLRFFFTWQGKSIDRHVSPFLFEQFQQERLQHLIKKKTQGLPWRIIPKSTTSWSTLNQSGGLFRSLKGLSRTHTRSLYKSQVYRKGWIAEFLNGEDKITCKTTHKTSNAWIQALSPCRWCKNVDQVKGNRIHAALFCEHEKLRTFRSRMTRLIEQRLKAFLDCIQTTQNKFVGAIFLQEIEKTLHSLHNLKQDETDSNKYRTRFEWMREENIGTWRDMLASEIPVLSAVFGFTPVSEASIPDDEYLTQANCIPLGVMPKQLDSCIKELEKNVRRQIHDPTLADSVAMEYRERWEVIKEINVARAVGMHRITATISKDFERDFKSKYNIDDGSCKKIKRILTTQQIEHPKNTSILRKRKHNPVIISTTSKPAKKKVRFREKEIPDKVCIGITCARDCHQWSMGKFNPNRIAGTQKHCQRCSKQCTAIRKAAVALEICMNSDDSMGKETLVSDLDNQDSSSSYSVTKRKLTAITHEKDNIVTPPPIGKRKKTRCSDTEKIVLNTIKECMLKHTDTSTTSSTRITTAVGKLKQMDEKINNFLKNDLKLNAKIRKQLNEEKSYKQKNIILKGSNGQGENGQVEKIWLSNKFQRSQHTARIQTGGFNQLIGGDSIKLAVMNIRTSAPSGIFCANAAAAEVIKTCNSNEDWRKFATCFGNKAAMQKPHGIYLIPIFEGGHWYLMVIQKMATKCKGWIIDSLGTGSSTGDIAQRVKKLFSKARQSCVWNTPQSTRQTENECGARTLWSMVSICDCISQSSDMDSAILNATTRFGNGGVYDSMVIRRKTAALMKVTEETKMAYEAPIAEMRRWLKRQERRHGGNFTRSISPEKVIDLC